MARLATFVLCLCYFFLLVSGKNRTDPSEVDALKEIRSNLVDNEKNLNDWEKTDPCESKWKGVFCTKDPNDGYYHVQKLRLLSKKLSGNLSPELGKLSYVKILDFSWNNISGSIPKEIGNLLYLEFLLLSSNQLSGSLPDELGNLSNIVMLSLDDNYISGTLPKTFAKLTSAQHFHLSNNSISGQIPPEISTLPKLLHLLLDNNSLTGYLPPQFSELPSLKILQVDNNNFQGTEIPVSYGNMTKLVKLSLRNCSLEGPIPDLSSISSLMFLDLSLNQLNGSIPTNKLSDKITTIDLSYNSLSGSIPQYFSGFPRLQRLSLQNNTLSGSLPSNFWQNVNFGVNGTLILDFQNNWLTNVSGTLLPPSNVTIGLQGNPVCSKAKQFNIVQFCGLKIEDDEDSGSSRNFSNVCSPQSCPNVNMECVPGSPFPCCAAPFGVELYLRSPSISNFLPYRNYYSVYLISSLALLPYQLGIVSVIRQKGSRLWLYLEIFPQCINDTSNLFNTSEIQRITNIFASYIPTPLDTFGPYELISFLLGPYAPGEPDSSNSGMSTGSVIAIVLGSFALVAISFVIVVLFRRKNTKFKHDASKKETITKIPIRTDSVKDFSFKELEEATSGFSANTQVGQGGYGKVYRGILANGTVVAIKRAQKGSLQGQSEFLTEIEFLCRLHHRNLVSLVGYCDEEEEQMLVYEFMPNGSLRDLLSATFRNPVSFAVRLHIALGSAKGILYLHTEADPPIIHRDIKANNILLDSKFTAKVSDFGISRLAPVPNVRGVVSHVSTAVKGTPGYVDPEYFLTHKLTEKSDVYSLGIVFLELLTAMKPISHGRNIVREVNAACESRTMLSIIDRTMGLINSECLRRFMALALKCCEDTTEARPLMLEVVRELENISSMLLESDTVPTNSDVSAFSGSSGFASSSLYSRGSSQASADLADVGCELVSGVIPSIKAR